jgi:hypothetical protein
MKNILTVVLFLATTFTFAQEHPLVGVKFGANYSILSHTEHNSTHSFIPGFNAGIFAMVNKTEMFHIRPELYFSTQGQKNTFFDATGSGNGSTTFKFYAVNLPILFEYGRKFVVQAGPQIGAILYGKESGVISGITIDNNLKDSLKPMDVSVVGGFAWYPNERVNVGVRYNVGVTPVLDRELNSANSPKLANRVFQVYVAYGMRY